MENQIDQAPPHGVEGTQEGVMPIASSPNVADGRNFPTKLHACLTELEGLGLLHIASFQPHGRCFKVHKQDEFVTTILPRWFNQTKYSSFQRQLNLYGFQRITSGMDRHGYFHPSFLRGHPVLVNNIQRFRVKGQGPRRASDCAPNFYAMAPLPTTPTAAVETARNVETREQRATAGSGPNAAGAGLSVDALTSERMNMLGHAASPSHVVANGCMMRNEATVDCALNVLHQERQAGLSQILELMRQRQQQMELDRIASSMSAVDCLLERMRAQQQQQQELDQRILALLAPRGSNGLPSPRATELLPPALAPIAHSVPLLLLQQQSQPNGTGTVSREALLNAVLEAARHGGNLLG